MALTPTNIARTQYDGLPRWVGLACKEGDALDTAALIKQRKQDAFNFYLSQGFDEADIPSHLTGIDFTKPVDVVTLPKGSTVYQFQSPGAMFGYRPGVTAYRVKENTPAAFGITRANPQHGQGGLPQIVIEDYEAVLEPLYSVPLSR